MDLQNSVMYSYVKIENYSDIIIFINNFSQNYSQGSFKVMTGIGALSIYHSFNK